MDHRTSKVVSAASGQAPAGDAAPKAKKPFWVECNKCRHQWAAAYLPMDVALFAKAAKAICPMCGNGPRGILIAKQHDGVLTEPTTTAQGSGA